jgi:hypothetical protein
VADLHPPAHDQAVIGAMIEDLRAARSEALSAFDRLVFGGDPQYDSAENVAWFIETAFLKLLAVFEVLNLSDLKSLVLADIRNATATKDGFAASAQGPDDPYSVWLSRYYQYLSALETLGGGGADKSVTKDLTEILRASEYVITDGKLFGHPPASEDDVHRRIEGVLRCVFPDLKRKPSLTKPIKNFEPDTGLPSVRTLLEYKFLSREEDVPTVADQILADTRGYTSRDWDSFVYVIYETKRFKPEHEWNDLLRHSAVTNNALVVVLSGEPAPMRSKGARRRGSQL